MRTSNEHIAEVVRQYGLGDHRTLRAANDVHVELAGTEPCIDHATFVAAYHWREKFVRHWQAKGLKAVAPLHTSEYPAEHIALVRGPDEYEACDAMIGLSVSPDEHSPINELLRRHEKPRRCSLPGTLQHVAVNVDPSVDMHAFVDALKQRDVQFMTPVLVSEQTRFDLSQAFTATSKAYGHFIEFIQRTPVAERREENEDAFFNTRQIDSLLRYYDERSRKLLGGY